MVGCGRGAGVGASLVFSLHGTQIESLGMNHFSLSVIR